MTSDLPPIFILCYKLDFFLTKIVVASIRYYYPDVEISLIKDEIEGDFSTKDLEHYFQVKVVPLERKKYGWTSAKIFLLLSKKLSGRKILLLDSDTALVGRVLEKIASYYKKYDFVVSPEYKDKPGDRSFTNYYYDFNKVKSLIPELVFPGHTFNTGNIVVTAGSFTPLDVNRFFNPRHYPYWTPEWEKLLPTRDQSLLNILLPIKTALGKITCGKVHLMWWCKDPEAKNLSIEDIRLAKYPFLIHWAGTNRSEFLPATERGDILLFFQKQYFERLPFGKIRFYLNLFIEGSKYYFYYYPRQLIGIDKVPDWMKEE